MVGYTASGRLERNDPLWPPMEAGAGLGLLALLGEGNALVGDFVFQLLDRRDVLVDDRLVDERPEGFGGLRLWTVGRQINQANASGDRQAGCAMPSGIVKHKQDDASNTGFGFARERFEQRLEEWFRYAVGKIPEGFTGGRRCESRDIEPIEPMMAMRDRTLADGSPSSPSPMQSWVNTKIVGSPITADSRMGWPRIVTEDEERCAETPQF